MHKKKGKKKMPKNIFYKLSKSIENCLTKIPVYISDAFNNNENQELGYESGLSSKLTDGLGLLNRLESKSEKKAKIKIKSRMSEKFINFIIYLTEKLR